MKNRILALAAALALLLLTAAAGAAAGETAEKNGDIVILFTSDVHCGIDQNFGFAGLQQILDALELGAALAPIENGSFLQVSGLTYEIHTYIPSGVVTDEDGMFVRTEGERRVKNVRVSGEPIEPEKTYTLAGRDFMLTQYGGGFKMFEGAGVLQDSVKVDTQVMADYINETLGGTVGAEYEDPYGQGRITIIEKPE